MGREAIVGTEAVQPFRELRTERVRIDFGRDVQAEIVLLDAAHERLRRRVHIDRDRVVRDGPRLRPHFRAVEVAHEAVVDLLDVETRPRDLVRGRVHRDLRDE